jgi:hypothetical protein
MICGGFGVGVQLHPGSLRHTNRAGRKPPRGLFYLGRLDEIGQIGDAQFNFSLTKISSSG